MARQFIISIILIWCLSAPAVFAQRHINNTKELAIEFGPMNRSIGTMFYNNKMEYRAGVQLSYFNTLSNIWTVGVEVDQQWQLGSDGELYNTKFYTSEISYGLAGMIDSGAILWIRPNIGGSFGVREHIQKLIFVYGLVGSLELELFLFDKLALFGKIYAKYFFEISKIQFPATIGFKIMDF